MRFPMLVSALVCMAGLAACEGANESAEEHLTAQRTDPQVVQDVVDYFLPLPDSESQARGRRIENFTNGIQAQECGGKPIPLDLVLDTSGNLYPDLTMIRERGLAVIYSARDYYKLDGDPFEADTSCAQKRAQEGEEPTIDFNEIVQKVAGPWQDYSLTAATGSEVRSQKARMAACLRDGSQLKVSEEDPDTSFKNEVDRSYLRVDDPVDREQVMNWSTLYVECAEPYFAELDRLLKAERPDAIERNREVIEKFAANLVKLGYVP